MWHLNNGNCVRNVICCKQSYNELLSASTYSPSYLHTVAYMPSIVQSNVLCHWFSTCSTSLLFLILSLPQTENMFLSMYFSLLEKTKVTESKIWRIWRDDDQEQEYIHPLKPLHREFRISTLFWCRIHELLFRRSGLFFLDFISIIAD